MSANGRNPASRICVLNIDIRGVRGVSQSTCHALLPVGHARFCPPTVSVNGFLDIMCMPNEAKSQEWKQWLITTVYLLSD